MIEPEHQSCDSTFIHIRILLVCVCLCVYIAGLHRAVWPERGSNTHAAMLYMKLGVMKDVWIKASFPSNLGSVGRSLPPEAQGFVGIWNEVFKRWQEAKAARLISVEVNFHPRLKKKKAQAEISWIKYVERAFMKSLRWCAAAIFSISVLPKSSELSVYSPIDEETEK